LKLAVLALVTLLIFPPSGSSQESAGRPITFKQGWTTQERRDFYHLSLGSELFPLSWTRALASAATKQPFLKGLDRFGYLDDPGNAEGLPIGLTAAKAKLDPSTLMLGMNCAACHVAEMTVSFKTYRIDGAPNVLIDLVGFNADLAYSVTRIATDPGEFAAFQLRAVRSPEEKARLAKRRPLALQALEALAHWDTSTSANQMHNALTDVLGSVFQPKSSQWPLVGNVSGMPHLSEPVSAEFKEPLKSIRTDATPTLAAFVRANAGEGAPLGVVADAQQAAMAQQLVDHFIDTVWYVKQASGLMLKQDQLRRIPGGTPAGPGRVDDFRLARNLIVNELLLALPADSPTSIPILWGTNRVKWLGWDANADSTMQRNIATAIAVGADFDRETATTSIPPGDVYRLEAIGSSVLPPTWPFGPINHTIAARGAALYQQRCVACHIEPDSVPPSETSPNWLPDLLYDPASLPNGKTKVDPAQNVGTDPNRALNFVQDLVNPSAGAKLDTGLALLQKLLYLQNRIGPPEAKRLLGDRTETWRSTGKYAGRPLTAIWAAAPYLHNDSVPTLHDLLEPAGRRPATFRRGGREFDPIKIGYREPSTDKPAFVFDTSLSGNHNTGHEYGTDLAPRDRRALLEYLKTK